MKDFVEQVVVHQFMKNCLPNTESIMVITRALPLDPVICHSEPHMLFLSNKL